MKYKNRFLARYGSPKDASDAITNDPGLARHALKNPYLSKEHVSSLMGNKDSDIRRMAMLHDNADPDKIAEHLHNEFNKGGYPDQDALETLSASKSLTPDHLRKFANHDDSNVSLYAFKNPNFPKREGLNSKHIIVQNSAIRQVATSEELHHYIKNGTHTQKISAISSPNTKSEHIDTALANIPKGDIGDRHEEYIARLGKLMMHHNRVEDLPDERRGVELHTSHANLAKLHPANYDKLKKNFEIDVDDPMDSNVIHIMTSHPSHINDALSKTDDVRYGTAHNMLLASQHVTDETLHKVGTHAAKAGYSGEMVAASAAMHPNASRETRTAIVSELKRNGSSYADHLANHFNKK